MRPSGHPTTEWELERIGAPRGYYEFAGQTHIRLSRPIGDGETVKHGR